MAMAFTYRTRKRSALCWIWTRRWCTPASSPSRTPITSSRWKLRARCAFVNSLVVCLQPCCSVVCRWLPLGLLVLFLQEPSWVRPFCGGPYSSNACVRVMLGCRAAQVVDVYVLKRPHMDAFMAAVGAAFEVVVFTASLAKYADPLLDLLDKGHVVRGSRSMNLKLAFWNGAQNIDGCAAGCPDGAHGGGVWCPSQVRWRLFRESCCPYEGNYVKDLLALGRPLSTTIIVDNRCASIFRTLHSAPTPGTHRIACCSPPRAIVAVDVLASQACDRPIQCLQQMARVVGKRSRP